MFSGEFTILREARNDILQLPSSQEAILEKYTLLIDHYDKLLRTALKLSRISDIQGQSLTNQNHRLKQQSETDFLTSLYNVRKLGESIPTWMAAGIPFVLLLLDIDYFKKINDTYGHLSGDEVLKTLATILQEHTRPEDFVCRSGGEEFSILLHNVGLLQAEGIAQNIRQKVEEQEFWLIAGESVGITVSMGLVEYAPGMSSEDLLVCADDALYLSKELGRNKVSLFPPLSDKRHN
ncbi:GGDEF domain-containing protein [Paenibacillus agricola]|uniref:GGDEF domain-containing protein n=1 Tax=Paenibacillus agricola TaxID=2716264 RepID=A0ABX0J7R2_9BACL|nr:GGDEF domain-containing protein [Paenibacillus agricola]NHN32467.1 GGDEF domain-containing protein [Paenibacillus agricola]